MYCKNCGSKIEEGSAFCSACGQKVIQENEMNGTQSFQTQTLVANNINKKAIAVVSVFVVVIVAVIIVVFTAFHNSPENKIVGYWKTSGSDTAFVFYKDNTLWTNGIYGTYSISGNKLNVAIGNKSSSNNKATFSFEIKDDVLTLSYGKSSSSYVKLTPTEIAALKNETHIK